MPGETDLHKTLKKEGCRWLWRMGYKCVAAEVRLKPLGIIDVVGTGIFRPYHNYLACGREVHQTCFVECKASRSDFLRDCDDPEQMTFAMMERRTNRKGRRRRLLRQSVGLGKFRSCLLQPMANIHYVLAPAGIIQKKDLPPRWGLLTLGPGGISVTVKAEWQEVCQSAYVEGAIARTLSGDIFNADQRAISSVNRELVNQQQQLAERIKAVRPLMVQHLLGDTAGDGAAAGN
jgi:hypothetical protein